LVIVSSGPPWRSKDRDVPLAGQGIVASGTPVGCRPDRRPARPARYRATASVSAKRSSGSTQIARVEGRPRELGDQAGGAELGRDLGVQLLPRRELDDQPEVAHRRRHRTHRAQPHLDPLPLGVPQRDVGERVDVEVGVQLAVEHVQDVPVELRRHPRRVVVRGDEHCRVGHQRRAEQQVLAGPQGGAHPARNSARCGGSRLPIVPPRNASRRRSPFAAPASRGRRSRWTVKSPTTPCRPSAGYRTASASSASRSAAALTSSGT
jgi:hypothetical protein